MQIEIIRSKRRHVIETSVNARGEVIMRIPYNTGKEEIQRTLQKQREWILRHVEKAKQEAEDELAKAEQELTDAEAEIADLSAIARLPKLKQVSVSETLADEVSAVLSGTNVEIIIEN